MKSTGDETHLSDGGWGPALGVSAVVLGYLVGLPLVEMATARDQAPPAIQIELPIPTHLASATFQPAGGWQDSTPTGTADPTHVLSNGAVTFSIAVRADPGCKGGASGIDVVVADDPSIPEAGRPYVTRSSLRGTVRSWSGPTTQGMEFNACEEGVLVTVVAHGPEGSLSRDGFAAVSAMLDSVVVG